MQTPDGGTLATIASVTAAFGTAVLLFRIQREDSMLRMGERVWLPVADMLILIATLISILLVLVPVAADWSLRLSAAASVFSSICVAGYVPAILAHYRIFFGSKRTGPRDNPEPKEGAFVAITIAAGLVVSLLVLASPP